MADNIEVLRELRREIASSARRPGKATRLAAIDAALAALSAQAEARIRPDALDEVTVQRDALAGKLAWLEESVRNAGCEIDYSVGDEDCVWNRRAEELQAQQAEAQAGGEVAWDEWLDRFAETCDRNADAQGWIHLADGRVFGSRELYIAITSKIPPLGTKLYTTPPPSAVAEGSEIVGHKTFDNGRGGFRHEPLTRAEADALIAHCHSEDERRKALMPDERSAIRMMMDAHTRLTDMGWRDPVYCPKDGSTFEVIEPGSTGIHKCIYMGEWPKGSWWALGDGDMYPSRPVLFRPLAAAPGQKEDGRG